MLSSKIVCVDERSACVRTCVTRCVEPCAVQRVDSRMVAAVERNSM